MAMVDVRVETDDLRRVLAAYGTRDRNVSMKLVAEELKVAIDDVLQAEGAVAGGKKWDPLTASTLKRHPGRRGKRILQATGLLANIQTTTSGRSATAESPARYAGFHVGGTKHMAKRNFLAIDIEATLERIGATILTEVDRGG